MASSHSPVCVPNDHGLIGGIIYGPVTSRRFGKTLGINILPSGRKWCTFHCVYCQLGSGEKKSKVPMDFPSSEDVRIAWNKFQKISSEKTDYIVVSGNGEPTLNPQFLPIVEELVKLRGRDLPKVKLICFTNGSRLVDSDIFKALCFFDECHLKLDANLHEIDIPENDFSLATMIEVVRALPNLVIQSCFVTGRIDNMDEVSLAEWQNQILSLKPKRVDLYTILRQPAWDSVLAVRKNQLASLAQRLKSCGQNVKIV